MKVCNKSHDNHMTLQAGLLIGGGLSPFLIRRSDTDEVCGNDTATPTSSQELFDDWCKTIDHQLFYYLVGQGGLALIILVLTLVGGLESLPACL